MADTCCSTETSPEDKSQRRAIVVVMLINLSLFFIEGTFGFIAQSSSLLADAVDMGGDALVYFLSLLALGKTLAAKSKVAIFNSGFQLILGLAVLAEVISKLFREAEPISSTMLIVGSLALLANLCSGAILLKYRSKDINMKAVWNCTRNDIVNNFFTLLAAGGVHLTASKWPDIVAGFIIAGLIIHFSFRTLRESIQSLEQYLQS